MVSPRYSATGTSARCARCGRALAGHISFAFESERWCTRCVLRRGPLVRRSALAAVVVGTVLVAINQGNVLLEGSFPQALYWKIPLTYVVPYCVATWGALINSRVRARREEKEDDGG